MSEFKGTPGPWLNAGRSAGSHIHADKGEVAWLRSNMGINDKEIEANSRLIAAAPELLDALIDVQDFLKRSGYDTKMVKYAIAKALGGQK